MNVTPSPNGHKVRKERSSTRTLRREIETAWNREIPPQTLQAIPWLVLSSFVDNLSHRLDPNAVIGLRDAVKSKSVKGYLKVGADFGVPQRHVHHADYFVGASVFNLFKKFPWIESELNPREKAIERFREAERLCWKTNRRFSRHRLTDFSSKSLTKRFDAHQIFHLARRKIERWLGDCNPGAIFSSTKFGPGGCVGTSRPYTTPFYKLGVSDYTVTSGAYWHAIRFINKNEAWVRALLIDQHGSAADDQFNASYSETEYNSMSLDQRLKAIDSRVQLADYNKVTFVPKDASTERAIATEPHLNVMLQLAAGEYLKKCLLAAGCDLKSQVRNQLLALAGSLSDGADGVATIDLRMASDCLARELVRELLPCEWFEFLDSLRSREGRFAGKTITWEKFSSMGNGFTFELESMVFYALAQSVSDLEGTTEWYADTFGPKFKYAELSVFGDDIVVPKRCADKLVKILLFCGFQTNLSKTFTSGSFRESCGKDYFDGVLVRPFYMKRSLSQYKDLIHLRNNVKGLIYDGLYELAPAVELIDNLIPPVLLQHLVGPRRTTGDESIWSNPDSCHRSKLVVWDTDYQAWQFPVIRQSPICVPLTGRHMVGWAYAQFLYANTDRCVLDREKPDYHANDSFSQHVNAGGSSGDVVLSGQSGPGYLSQVSV